MLEGTSRCLPPAVESVRMYEKKRGGKSSMANEAKAQKLDAITGHNIKLTATTSTFQENCE